MFSLIVNLSNYPDTNGPKHSFIYVAQALSFVQNPGCQTFFEPDPFGFFAFLIAANNFQLVAPQYQSLAESLVHHRKRKPKQQRCSPSRLILRSMTYLISTSIWSPRVSMATKTFHSPAATSTSSSLSTRCQVTVAICRPVSPPPSALVSLPSPGLVKISGSCRKSPARLPNRAAFL